MYRNPALAMRSRSTDGSFLARRAIRERRPRAVVAVACERDMVSGIHDVAAKIPVLGLTMRLPSGPCKDAAVDVAKFETWVQSFVGQA